MLSLFTLITQQFLSHIYIFLRPGYFQELQHVSISVRPVLYNNQALVNWYKLVISLTEECRWKNMSLDPSYGHKILAVHFLNIQCCSQVPKFIPIALKNKTSV